MAEPLGLVPRGAEGTGAAQIFRPFDSTPIFNAYDQQRRNLEVNLRNSFDDPVSKSTGTVHPNDRWYIQQARDQYLDARTKVMAQSLNKLKQPSPEELAELTRLKQEVSDRLSLAQKMYETNAKERQRISQTPYAFTPESRQAILTYHDTPIDKRQIFAEAQKIPGFNYSEIIRKIGDTTKKREVSVTRPDSSSYTESKVEFDPEKAESAFITQFLPMLNTTDWGVALTDMLRSDLIEQDPNYLSYSPDKQAELFTQAARNYFITTKKNEKQLSVDTDTRAAKKDDGSGAGGGKKVNITQMQPVVGREYVIYDVATGKRKGKQGGVEKGEGIKLTDAITIPIVYKETTPAENKIFTFLDKGKPIKGTPHSLRRYKGSKGWDKNYSLLVFTEPDKYNESKVVEIPFVGDNRVKLEKEFGFNLDEINKKYGNLEKKAEDLPKSNLESIQGWDDMSEEAKEIYRNAYNEYYSSGATPPAPVAPVPPPASPALKKYKQQYGRK